MTATQTWESVRTYMEDLSPSELRSIVRRRDQRVWTEMALDVADEICRERGNRLDDVTVDSNPPVPRTTCSQCGERTEPGHVTLGSGLLAFLFIGFSWSPSVSKVATSWRPS